MDREQNDFILSLPRQNLTRARTTFLEGLSTSDSLFSTKGGIREKTFTQQNIYFGMRACDIGTEPKNFFSVNQCLVMHPARDFTLN